MRFQLLLISLASLFILSLGNPEDVLNIQKLNNDFAVLFDSNKKGEISTLFTANLTYNLFTKTRGNFTIRGGQEFNRLITNITEATIDQRDYTSVAIPRGDPIFDFSAFGAGAAMSG